MNSKEAYKIIKDKFPNKHCNVCVLWNDRYLFTLFPAEGSEEMKKVEEGMIAGYMHDDTWSVNIKTGEINRYKLWSDPLKLAHYMAAEKHGQAKTITLS